ncbi:MAG: hypothetical protein PHE55_08855 [Methylococcaceae bacterium]|nr:hypothetical protein [Methylococcaceae bacterium]
MTVNPLTDVSRALDGLEESITRKRKATGSYASLGRYTEGAETSATIVAHVQPISGRDLIQVEEGRRANAIITIYSKTELKTGDDTGVQPDTVTFGGEDYEVFKVEPWGDTGAYYKALAQKKGQ